VGKRGKLIAGLAALAASAAIAPWLASSSGGGIDVFVGSTPTPAGASNVANLWVDGAGSCTRQPTAGLYVDAQACTDIAAAYSASSADDVIRVKAGTYSSAQNLNGSHGTAGHPVTITVAQGEAPNVTGEVQFQSSHIVFKGESNANKLNAGIYICKASVSPSCTASSSSITDLVIQYLDNAGSYWMRGGNNITIRDSVFHDWTDFTSQLTNVDTVLFERDVFRDAHLVTAGSHTDCMGIFGTASNITVRGSRFYNCEHADILIDSSDTGTNNSNVVLENNIFEDALTPGVNVGMTKCDSCTARYNTFGPTEGVAQVDTGTGDVWTGNMIGGGVSNGAGACGNATWTYNLSAGTMACAGTGNAGGITPGWVSTSGTGGASDFHLSSCGAAPINVGGPSNFPSIDFDSVARPVGSAVDVGAFERAGC
jgi:hypothetical protein